MTRRRIIAGVILALVVATVVASWDALTVRTVEEYWPNGGLRSRSRFRLWDDVDSAFQNELWHENGRLCMSQRRGRFWKVWIPSGQLVSYLRKDVGVYTELSDAREIMSQTRRRGLVTLEERTSPPWFTEQEILQAVEGVEE